MYSYNGGKSQSGGAPSSSAASLRNYEFDFGLGAGFSGNQGASRPLRDQKNPSATPPTKPSPPGPPFSAASAPNRASWTHQPSPAAAAAAGLPGPRSSLNNPTSMVGDIYGKSWFSTAPSSSGVGIPKSDPNLFGDLVGSAFGQAKSGGGSNVPLKAAPPRNAFFMGNLSDSLPKTTAGASNQGRPNSRGSANDLGSYYPSSVASNVGSTTGNSLGGQPMRSSGGGASARKDPFGSLLDFGRKKSTDPSPTANPNFNTNSSSAGDYSFGAFQDADNRKTASKAAKLDDFGMPPVQDLPEQKTPTAQPKVGVDPLDVLFSSTASFGAGAAAPAQGHGSQSFEADDWNFVADFGDHDSGGTTTDLEGLPPPPAGVTPSMAMNKGLENQKQGQFADAIKWLSWAVILLEKSGGASTVTEVLACRASCYKEVGEYKKAVADCSKVLEHDSTNVTALLQRALLYESTEKYKLGAEDLRAVLKIDPGNRLAKSTIHRLTQMAG
ncbi:hypothetical protein Taro_041661 [Colocasia esculenta]|uniref:Uncharacterized protein n=1 Tax=Colocasia esculenta TaxID=4460 RepID=A0A843WEY0_COLES|nr:hypothetical protein [Colocasia esculenta]